MWRGGFETLFGQGARRSYELLLKVLNACCLPCQRYLLPPEGVAAPTREALTRGSGKGGKRGEGGDRGVTRQSA